MTHSAQAGARRVIPLLAAGVGIAVAIMAFAPAATSPPPGVAVGVHEADYEVEGEEGNSIVWNFKVHTAIELRDAQEFYWVAERIAAGDYGMMVDTLIGYHGYKIQDSRAGGIIQAIRLAPDTTDTQELDLSVSTEWHGRCGYWFHVSMEFKIPPPPGVPPDSLHVVFIGYLQDGNLDAIRHIMDGWRVDRWIHGDRPVAILAQIRRSQPPHRR